MIFLSPVTVIMLYLGITLTVIFVLWLFSLYSKKKKNPISPKEQLYLCEFCHFIYLDGYDKTVNKCPQCETLNKENQYRVEN